MKRIQKNNTHKQDNQISIICHEYIARNLTLVKKKSFKDPNLISLILKTKLSNHYKHTGFVLEVKK